MHNTSDAHTIMSSTSSVRSVTFAATQLQALRARVKGRVFVPGDEGYDTARQTWNVTTFDQRPAVVVMPSTRDDVASALGSCRVHQRAGLRPCPVRGRGAGRAGDTRSRRWHTHRVVAMLVFLSCARSGAARLRGVSESQTGSRSTSRTTDRPPGLLHLNAWSDFWEPLNVVNIRI